MVMLSRRRFVCGVIAVWVLARSFVGESLASGKEQRQEQGQPQDSSLHPHCGSLIGSSDVIS